MSALRKTTMRLTVLAGAFVATVVGVGPARADECVIGQDPGCTPVVVTNWPPVQPQYVVAYLDNRQFTALLFVSAITAAITLATFVWRASAGLSLGARR